MKEIETYTVEEVTHFLGKPAQFVRLGLQQGRFPFGVAVRGTGGRYSYLIPKRKFSAMVRDGG